MSENSKTSGQGGVMHRAATRSPPPWIVLSSTTNQKVL